MVKKLVLWVFHKEHRTLVDNSSTKLQTEGAICGENGEKDRFVVSQETQDHRW